MKDILTPDSFACNTAANKGGAIYAEKLVHMRHKHFAATLFRNNVAKYDGAIFTKYHSSTMFSNNSTIIFANNTLLILKQFTSLSQVLAIAIQNFTIIFTSKWCNKRCLPHPKSYNLDINDSVVINGDGAAWCTCVDRKNFKCESTSCYGTQVSELLHRCLHVASCCFNNNSGKSQVRNKYA